MTDVRVRPATVERVLKFVNTWARRVHDAAGTSVDHHASIGSGSDGHPAVGADVSAREAAAASLHEVFDGPDSTGRRDCLNALVARLDPTPLLTTEGEMWAVESVHEGFGELILGLWLHAREDPELSRLGTCADERCVDAYVDHTQAGSRRYCSTTCQNRAGVREHRRRGRT